MGLRALLSFTCAGVLVAASLAGPLAPRAGATSLSDFAVFGGGGVVIWGGSTVNGQVGSNGGVFAQASTLNGPVVGGGAFASGNWNHIFGDMRFNGGVTLEIDDVLVGRTYSSGYNAVALLPTMYPGDPLEISSFPDGSTVTLSGGKQYHSAAIALGALDLTLDLTHGPIHVYVDGAVTLADVKVFLVWEDGQTPIPYSQAIAVPVLRALAQNVYFETHGGWYGTGEWFGQIYAPVGSVSIMGAGNNVTGSLWAGQSVFLDAGSDVNVIPEPVTAVGLVLGLSALAGCVRRRRAASDPSASTV